MSADRECPWNGDFSGKKNLPGFFKAVGEALDITIFDVQAISAAGAFVAVYLHIESTLRKNGRQLKNDAVHFWTFNERGHVTRYRHFNDTAAELAAWRGTGAQSERQNRLTGRRLVTDMRSPSVSFFRSAAVWAALAVTPVLAQSAAGLKWTAPVGWKVEAARPMRAATYTVPPAPGDRDGGEVVINYFGPGQGGSIDANVARWKGQVQGPDGKAAVAIVAQRNVRGIPITTLDSSGAYSGMGGPMMAPSAAQPGYRLLGAIVEGPGGMVFVKFAGPAKTVAANRQKFDQLLASFDKEK